MPIVFYNMQKNTLFSSQELMSVDDATALYEAQHLKCAYLSLKY